MRTDSKAMTALSPIVLTNAENMENVSKINVYAILPSWDLTARYLSARINAVIEGSASTANVTVIKGMKVQTAHSPTVKTTVRSTETASTAYANAFLTIKAMTAL